MAVRHPHFGELNFAQVCTHRFTNVLPSHEILKRAQKCWSLLCARFWMVLPLAALGCFFISPAKADSIGGCRAVPIKPYEFAAASEMATQLAQYLERHNNQIVLVARVGSDLSKRGLKYTHAGLVWRDHPKGKWRFVHQLNTCGAGLSQIYDQGLINFFLDDPYSYDIKVLHLKPGLQTAIARALKAGIATYMHRPTYSMLSYPRSTRYQNSNEWLLEVVTAAEMIKARPSLPSHREVQTYHRAKGFHGSVVNLTFIEKVYGTWLKENVRFSDHPADAQTRRRFEFVSVRALFSYLRQRGLGTDVIEIPGIIPRKPRQSARIDQPDHSNLELHLR